jgi:hypothetical protein
MATTAHSTSARRGISSPSPAQAFCGLVGAVLILVGILGFFGNSSFGGAGERGTFLGLDVNGWHNVVHIVTGLLLLAGVPNATMARVVCVLFGLSYALVALLGWIDGSDVLGLIPIDTADNILHTALAVLALVAAAAPEPVHEPARYDAANAGGQQDGTTGFAYDASSPNQVFVGLRGSAD